MTILTRACPIFKTHRNDETAREVGGLYMFIPWPSKTSRMVQGCFPEGLGLGLKADLAHHNLGMGDPCKVKAINSVCSCKTPSYNIYNNMNIFPKTFVVIDPTSIHTLLCKLRKRYGTSTMNVDHSKRISIVFLLFYCWETHQKGGSTLWTT